MLTHTKIDTHTQNLSTCTWTPAHTYNPHAIEFQALLRILGIAVHLFNFPLPPLDGRVTEKVWEGHVSTVFL